MDPLDPVLGSWQRQDIEDNSRLVEKKEFRFEAKRKSPQFRDPLSVVIEVILG